MDNVIDFETAKERILLDRAVNECLDEFINLSEVVICDTVLELDDASYSIEILDDGIVIHPTDRPEDS